MASASFSRREQARFCAIAQAAKAGRDLGKSQIDVSFDILGKDDARGNLTDDPLDLRPKVPRVVTAAPLSSEAERLAGITGSEDMNAAAPWATIKGYEVAPDRSLCQGRVSHPRHESGRSMGFPLDMTHSAISGLGDVDTKVEAAIAGAEREATKVAGA